MPNGAYRDSSIRYVSSEIERMADDLGLAGQVAENALRIYHQTLESEYDPPSLDDLAAACLYLSNLMIGQEATIRDVAAVSRKSQKRLRTVSNSLQSKLELPGIKIQTPEDVIEAKAQELEIEEHVNELKNLLQKVDDQYKGSKAPTAVAGATIYIGADIFGYDATQDEIAKACNITKVTIRNRYPELFKRSPITPPKDKRRFRSYDEALETLRDDLDLSDDVYERVDARVTLAKDGLAASVSKGGIVLAAVLVTVREMGVRKDLSDPETLSQYVRVGAATIDNHTESVQR